MKAHSHKMDQHLIATDQPYEISHVVTKMRAEGYAIARSDVKRYAKKVNNSRVKTYNLIRKNCRKF